MRWDSEHPAELRDKGMRGSRHQGRKTNTRRWCKGKEGVEHQPAVVMDKTWNRPCMEVGWFSRVARMWQPGGHWYCRHIEACTACGKYLRQAPECPDMPAGFIERARKG